MSAEALALDLLARGERVRFVARGDSMKPFVRDGDQVEVDPRPRPRVGDLVLLRAVDFGVVHRVIGKARGRLLIKGDNLPRADGWFGEDAVLGVVIAVRRGGRPVPTRRVVAVGWSAAMGLKRTRWARRLLGVLRRVRGGPPG